MVVVAVKDWLSPEDVAAAVGGVSAQHIRAEIKAGALPALDVRSTGASRPTYKIRRADALAYEAARLEHALAPTTPARITGPVLIQITQTTQTTR